MCANTFSNSREKKAAFLPYTCSVSHGLITFANITFANLTSRKAQRYNIRVNTKGVSISEVATIADGMCAASSLVGASSLCKNNNYALERFHGFFQ